MPLFMDIHRNVKATPEELAGAHEKDLEVGRGQGVDYLKYWHDEKNGTVFCLVRAPNKEAAERVHREGHGLVADEIHEVDERT
jgi:hypothetical protein